MSSLRSKHVLLLQEEDGTCHFYLTPKIVGLTQEILESMGISDSPQVTKSLHDSRPYSYLKTALSNNEVQHFLRALEPHAAFDYFIFSYSFAGVPELHLQRSQARGNEPLYLLECGTDRFVVGNKQEVLMAERYLSLLAPASYEKIEGFGDNYKREVVGLRAFEADPLAHEAWQASGLERFLSNHLLLVAPGPHARYRELEVFERAYSIMPHDDPHWHVGFLFASDRPNLRKILTSPTGGAYYKEAVTTLAWDHSPIYSPGSEDEVIGLFLSADLQDEAVLSFVKVMDEHRAPLFYYYGARGEQGLRFYRLGGPDHRMAALQLSLDMDDDTIHVLGQDWLLKELFPFLESLASQVEVVGGDTVHSLAVKGSTHDPQKLLKALHEELSRTYGASSISCINYRY